jgi:hypothetical protein
VTKKTKVIVAAIVAIGAAVGLFFFLFKRRRIEVHATVTVPEDEITIGTVQPSPGQGGGVIYIDQ